jgi:soluble lytic murein transglycosylase
MPLTHRFRRLAARAAALTLALWTAGALASLPTADRQREAYQQALDHLTAGRTGAFRSARTALDDYVLAPYLDYYAVQTRLTVISDADMLAFQERHADLPVTPILHQRWLRQLGARREWQRLLTHYRPTEDAELRCYRLRALFAAGQRDDALAGVPELWIAPRSQPKACDPLFEVWIGAGELTEAMAWERLQLALRADQRQLARYLLRFFEAPMRSRAQLLYDVHVDPRALTRTVPARPDDPYLRVVVGHGIRRLARLDAAAAAAAWQRYQDTLAFSRDEAQEITETVVLAMARGGEFPSGVPERVSDAFTEGMADAALARENWPALLLWIARLPEDRRSELRWQYWQARAMQHSHLHAERAPDTFRAIADERHYYGFLAAGQLGLPTRLNAAERRGDPAVAARVRSLAPVQRALELYAVGDLVNARREWFALVPRLDEHERYYAATLAAEAGWINQGISIANLGDLRDDVGLRFPIAYAEAFQKTSEATAIPKPFLLAVARQESAFDAKARSRANALGLMQLLHPTATQAARQNGLRVPTVTDLYDPDLNVTLGGQHLARLLERYQQRRPVAAAAYNAGEGRVDRWLRDASARSMDVWIETIPFRETRDYVKNVLAFTQVYGHLLESPQPVLASHETALN